MHSTQGNTSPSSPDQEYRGTINWFLNPAAQVSAHIVIGSDGRIAECVDPALIAWHARAENNQRLGIEIALSATGTHVTDEQLKSAAWWLRKQSARFGFPLTEAALPQHKDTPSGRQDGKWDISADYSFARLARFF